MDVLFNVYANTNFGAEKQQKCTTGFLVRRYGCPITLHTCFQRSIIENTAEAEFEAINKAVYEILYITKLTEKILHLVNYPITLYENNSAAITVFFNHE